MHGEPRELTRAGSVASHLGYRRHTSICPYKYPAENVSAVSRIARGTGLPESTTSRRYTSKTHFSRSPMLRIGIVFLSMISSASLSGCVNYTHCGTLPLENTESAHIGRTIMPSSSAMTFWPEPYQSIPSYTAHPYWSQSGAKESFLSERLRLNPAPMSLDIVKRK